MDSSLILDEIVASALVSPVPTVTRRTVRLASVRGKIDAVVGMRRSGKTYLLYQKMRELLEDGIAREQMLYLNFEDERLITLTTADLAKIPEAVTRARLANEEKEMWFFFDEIHNIEGWEKFLRRLVDEGGARIAVTGSSAKLLSKEIATSLRGRALSQELLPFSFQEFLTHRDSLPELSRSVSTKTRIMLEREFDSYIEVGGFPEVQRVSGDLHRRILQEYVDVALYRDVVERHRVSNTMALRHLVRRLLRSPALRISIHRLYGDFRSMGLPVGKDLLHEYLGYLEDAFMVFTVSIDSTSEKQKTVNPRKCYLVDHALAETVRFTTKEEQGFYLENVVYLELRRRGYEVSYYVTASGGEVDFCVRTRGDIVGLLQVTWDLSDPATRDREVRALAEAMKETATKQGMIVTLREHSDVRIDHGTISIVSAWRFLLET